MKNKNVTESQMKTIIISAIVFVIGVLFCCSLSFGIKGLSFLIGLSLVVTGILLLINTVIKQKAVFTKDGIIGAAVLALGISFMVSRWAILIFDYMPWLLIVLGATLILDALILAFKKQLNNFKFFANLLAGAATLALGLCLRLIDGFIDYAALILGIVLIVYSVFSIVSTFTKNGNEDKDGNSKDTRVESKYEPEKITDSDETK